MMQQQPTPLDPHQQPCPDCGQGKDTPITHTYCRRCEKKRITRSELEAALDRDALGALVYIAARSEILDEQPQPSAREIKAALQDIRSRALAAVGREETA